MKAVRRCLVVLALAVTGVAAAGGRDLPIIEAAKKADIGALRALLKQGADVTATQADGTTALHWTAYRDDLESADLLIRAGARVNAANDLGVTPLWTACENASTPMVRRLLQAGANPNVALLTGETLLMTAARTGNADVVKQLLAKGGSVNVNKKAARGQTALMWAVAQQHADVVEVLLAHGADVHARTGVWTEVVRTETSTKNHEDYIFDIQQGGYTPLLFAARVGDLASAKLLIAAGADVNETAPYGTSAIVVAAHSGYGELVGFLLERGADPNAGGAGYTALHAAILRQDEKAVAALLAHGADPNAPVLRFTPARRGSSDFYLHPAFVGATPFWLAARMNHQASSMRLLAKHGADPLFVHHVEHWVSGSGYQVTRYKEGATTALMAAVGMGGRVTFGEDGIEPDLVERDGPMVEAVKVAAELGVDVNAANVDGNTALHIVAARGYDAVAKFLVERGARLDARNKKGQTPLASAMAGPRPHESTVELLRKLGAKE